MAPELALERLPKKPARTLDQMIGSGTIPVFAGVAGHSATGYDLDPLALLIAEVWGRALDPDSYMPAAREVAEQAREVEPLDVPTDDAETAEFVERWFDEVARGRNPARLEQRTGRVDRVGSLASRLQESLGEQADGAAIEVGLPYVAGTYDETIFHRVLARRREFRCLLGSRPEWDDDSAEVDESSAMSEGVVDALQVTLGPEGD